MAESDQVPRRSLGLLSVVETNEGRWNVIVVHVQVRGVASTANCGVGLTMEAVVVVEMLGEISQQWEIW